MMSEKKSITFSFILVSLFFLTFYAPLLFEDFRFIHIHDNLDSEVVINKLISDYYNNFGSFGSSPPLNGALEFYALSRFTQPLTVIYALLPTFEAYLLSDLIVRATAFLGMFFLINELNSNLNSKIRILLSLIFSFSISYTVYLYTIAGLPAIFLIIMRIETEKISSKIIGLFLLFTIGLNISLPLIGIFLVVLIIPLLKYAFDCKITKLRFICILFLFFGIFLGNLNIFYIQLFSNEIWHRVEFSKYWIKDGLTLNTILNVILRILKGGEFYHTSYPIGISLFLASLLLVFKKTYTDKRVFFLFFMILLIFLTYIINMSLFMKEIEERINFLHSFNWSRIYFFYSFFIVCILAFSFSKISDNDKFVKASIALLSLQLAFIIYNTPHIKNIIKHNKNTETFTSHFMFTEYSEIKKIVRDNAVLSVGIDPMIAPMNNIKAIDGYYPLYPLSYKHEFSKIIYRSINELGNHDYYYSWGNRVYTFHAEGKENSINFCEAYKIGARFVISNKAMQDHRLINVWETNKTKALYLYKIANCSCN